MMHIFWTVLGWGAWLSFIGIACTPLLIIFLMASSEIHARWHRWSVLRQDRVKLR